MKMTWIRLACCALAAACGPSAAGGPAAGDLAPSAGDRGECVADAAGDGHPAALLRIGCDGSVVPGRAGWSRQGSAVTLEFAAAAAGPVGAELVSAWPPLDEPPWLGHAIEAVTVLSGGRVRVRFAAPAGEAPDEPERIFADPRLSGAPPRPPGDGVRDARDAIDAGSRVLTRHDASVEYARTLGHEVRLVAFDRLYLVAFAGAVEVEGARGLGAALGAGWAEWGAPGARRLPWAAMEWPTPAGRCTNSATSATSAVRVPSAAPPTGRPGLAADPARATVVHADGDRAAAQIAERIVSLALRGDGTGGLVQALARTGGRLAVRPTGESPPRRAPTDAAAVFAVHAGPGHPCSLHAEIALALAEWAPMSGGPLTNVVVVGESALFETRPR